MQTPYSILLLASCANTPHRILPVEISQIALHLLAKTSIRTARLFTVISIHTKLHTR